MKLSKESQARIERFKIHRDRCRTLEKCLGALAAYRFHVTHKADPASEVAKNEYERLLLGN